jgi:hypothetical protein
VDGLAGNRIGVGHAEIECQHGKQHQDTANECVQKEFDGCIFTSRAAPEADQKVHRQKHHFPEDEKEEKIECDKNSHHTGYQKQVEGKISLYHFINAPGRNHTDKAYK